MRQQAHKDGARELAIAARTALGANEPVADVAAMVLDALGRGA